MADTYEKDLGQKSSLTASDFIRVVGSDNVSYKQRFDAVMNDVPYTTNGKLKYISDIDDFNHITNEWVLTRSTTNAPVASTYFYVFTFAEARNSSGYVTTGKQIAFSYMTTSEDTYIRHGRNGTWGAWQKVPTGWESAGTATGTTAIALPSGWTELHVEAGANSQYTTFQIMSTGTFVNGRFPSNGGQVTITAQATSVNITSVYVGTTDQTASATIRVWYKK